MKTIIYLFIAITIFGSVATTSLYNLDSGKTILIQSTGKNVSSVSLAQSAQIISNRLKDYNSGKYEIVLIPEKSQIKVSLNKEWNLEIAEKLIIQKGKLEFYETYNYKSLAEFLPADNSLISLLHEEVPKDSSANIGCISSSEVKRVDEYLHSLDIDHKCRFVWSRLFENSETCLYAVRLNKEKSAVLSGNDIEIFKTFQDTTPKECYIEFQFKKPAIQIWSELTRRNLNSAIALLLDDNVIFCPTVRSVINEGNCQVTGNFTPAEIKYIAAIGNNGELPLQFTVIK
jgi:preprotein translocase subunit SecD